MQFQTDSYIFENRDKNFDCCRSFLVIAMIYTHAFNFFFLPDYNRKITFFVTIGFVLISGFSIGARYSNSLITQRLNYLKIFIIRSLKIFFVFIFFNLPIIIIDSHRFEFLKESTITSITAMIVTGDNDLIFSFDILPAIAFTSILSWFFLTFTKRIGYKIIYFSFIFPLVIFIIEYLYGTKLISVKLSIIGIFGCLIGKSTANINWKKFLGTISKIKITIWSGIFSSCYFVAIYFSLLAKGQKLMWMHAIPTLILLFFVYMFSYDHNSGKNIIINSINSTVGKYILFSYIFHIGFIRVIGLFIPQNLNALGTICMGTILTLITIAVCDLLDKSRKKSVIISRLYNSLFGL